MVRNSNLFIGGILLGILLMCLMFVDAAISRRIDGNLVEKRREMVRVLGLTDLCLFTEARYTRHPSMADRHTPFQNHPLALEHFPSGSLMVVPPQLRLPASR